MKNKYTLLATVVLSGALCLQANAQNFPNKPMRFIAPFPAGGSSDLIARILSQRMSEILGQPVVVDNRPGVSGSLGAAICARAPADGYTMLLGSVANLAINPHLIKNLGYDPAKDFTVAAALARGPQMLVVNPMVQAKSVQEFIALARAKPNAMICGSGGIGTPAHFGCELLRLRGNAQLLHVPYKGTGLSINDLIGGQIHAVFASMPVAYPHVISGKMRALAITSPQRSQLAPNLPTMLEAGVPGLVSESWWGAMVPAGTPGNIVRTLGAAIEKVRMETQSRERFAALGIEPLPLTPKEFAELMNRELVHYGNVVREAGIKSQ